MKQQFIDIIQSSHLDQNVTSKLLNGLTSRYEIEAKKATINLGDSKIGGYPHLPKYFEYPKEETYYYEFIAQINLQDVTNNEIPHLPTQGILYFFIDDDFNVANVNTKVFVLDCATAELEIKRPPNDLENRCEVSLEKSEDTELKLSFSKSYTTDQDLLDNILEGFDNPSIIDSIESLFTSDQIWGYTPSWGNAEAHWSAYLAKNNLQGVYWHTLDYKIAHLKENNIKLKDWLPNKLKEDISKRKETLHKYDNSLPIYPYWEKDLADFEYALANVDSFIENFENHKQESKKWRMLLSISSYSDAAISFGDGKMEFFIHIDDLKNQNYDNVYCQIYN